MCSGLLQMKKEGSLSKCAHNTLKCLQASIAFELALEKQAMENAIAPPADLKNKIMDEITAEGKVVSMHTSSGKKNKLVEICRCSLLVLLAGSIY